jgi:hypothetical protein
VSRDPGIDRTTKQNRDDAEDQGITAQSSWWVLFILDPPEFSTVGYESVNQSGSVPLQRVCVVDENRGTSALLKRTTMVHKLSRRTPSSSVPSAFNRSGKFSSAPRNEIASRHD